MPESKGRAGAKKGEQSVTTMICLTCGNEKYFDDAVPSSITCDKCGSHVFREFDTPTEPDEATLASLEEQARSMSYGDPSPDTTPTDVRDLNAL